MAKKVLFRADSSSIIGTGHIMRDLVLASDYSKRGYTIIFAVRNLPGNINYKILESGHKIKLLKSSKLSNLISIIKKYKVKEIVIDHYNIDWKYEKKLKQLTDINILSFDDTYLKHHCDTLLNHNIYADKKRYKTLVPKNSKIKCGPKYTLLRDEFKNTKSIKNIKKKSILIAMGGADTAHLNIKILKTLHEISNITINIITTTANKNLDELKFYVKNLKNITIHINTNKIAMLLATTSFAIITPSVTANEVSYMKIPFIAIKTASNQKEMYKYLKKKNINVLKEFNKELLLAKIYKLLKD